MTPLRIGLIGFGSWVRAAYLPALNYDGRAVITAATAATEKTRRQILEVLGGNVTIFESYETLLSNAQIDAVMIAVPDNIHQTVLSAAIESGVAVFYEPPVSHLRDQIPVMINRLLAAPQVTFAHLELCFHPAVERAVDLIKDNVIGLLHNVNITLHADWGITENSDLCLMNRMSCWYADVLNSITGSIPKRVQILDGYGSCGRMQSISTAIYDYDGVWGIFRANVSSPQGLSLEIEINGSKGDIVIDYFTGELRYRSMSRPQWRAEYCCPQKPYADWPGVRETVSAFIISVISKEPGRGNANVVAQLNMIGLAAEESKDTGGWAQIYTPLSLALPGTP